MEALYGAQLVIAVDTNVVVRFIVADHPQQFEQSKALFKRGGVLITLSVLLESEWVLRSNFNFSRDSIADAFSMLVGLESVSFDPPELIERVIAAHRDGVDFADALHVLSAELAGAEKLATFDKDLGRRSARIQSSIQIVSP